MKTKSLTILAALSAAFALNASALAGPDPQLVPSILRGVPKDKSVPTIALAGHSKAPTAAKSAKKADSTALVIPGPHGDNRIYRR